MAYSVPWNESVTYSEDLRLSDPCARFELVVLKQLFEAAVMVSPASRPPWALSFTRLVT